MTSTPPTAGLDETRVSCLDGAFPKLSHEVALAVIADLGFTAVDIGVFSGYRHHNPPDVVTRDPAGAANGVRRRVERLGLAVADVFVVLGESFDRLAVNHPDRSVREESRRMFVEVLRFSELVGSPGLTIIPGMTFEGVDVERSLELSATELQWRAALARERGVILSVEPHLHSIIETVGRTLALLEQAPDIALTLDYSHFVYQGVPQQKVDVLIPHARHLQLRQAAKGETQTPARRGAIDFSALVDRLVEQGYDGYLGVEYVWAQQLDLKAVDVVSETAILRSILCREIERSCSARRGRDTA